MLLVLSEIEPVRGTASAEILKRHLESLDEPYLYVGPGHRALQSPKWQLRLLNLVRSVAPHWANGYEQLGQAGSQVCGLPARLPEWSAVDLIVTVAHGRLGLNAWRLAEATGVPLVTFFHDWWPEMIREYTTMRPAQWAALDANFHALQKASAACLCVCEGMMEALEPDATRTLLLPVPDRAVPRAEHGSAPRTGPLRVVYTGSLWGVYGKLMTALAKALEPVPEIDLKIYGDAKYLDSGFVAHARAAGVLHDFLPYADYLEEISARADVLIGVMGMGGDASVRMQTSFPSKVANYFRTGNAVVLWADPHSSLGRFAELHQYPSWVREADPGAVVATLRRMAREPDALAAAREESARLATHEFDPDRLQQVFAESLETARQAKTGGAR
jgi:hypothetical protein